MTVNRARSGVPHGTPETHVDKVVQSAWGQGKAGQDGGSAAGDLGQKGGAFRPTKSPGPGAGASCSLACEATGGPSEQRGSRADLHRRRNNAGAARGVPHVAKFSAHGPPREIRRQAADVRLRSPTGVTHACFPPRDEIALLLRLHQSPSAELYCLNRTRCDSCSRRREVARRLTQLSKNPIPACFQCRARHYPSYAHESSRKLASFTALILAVLDELHTVPL